MSNPVGPAHFRRTAPSALASVLATLSVLGLGACAGQSEGLTTAAMPATETVNRLPPPASGYQLTASELELDCRKLTGRMAVRIVQIRDFQSRSQATSISRGLQTAAKPAFGGSGEGADPNARYARDRAQLDAFNRRLAEKNCANFDLDAELNPANKDLPRTRPLNRP